MSVPYTNAVTVILLMLDTTHSQPKCIFPGYRSLLNTRGFWAVRVLPRKTLGHIGKMIIVHRRHTRAKKRCEGIIWLVIIMFLRKPHHTARYRQNYP
eukprot:300217-Chlamydomonas_euryale.AAC.1